MIKLRISASEYHKNFIPADLFATGSLVALLQNTTKQADLPGHRQLLLDDACLQSRFVLTRIVHQPVKVPDPIIVGDQPCEN